MIDILLAITLVSFVHLIKYFRIDQVEDFWIMNKLRIQEIDLKLS